jgi:hypothetical protein
MFKGLVRPRASGVAYKTCVPAATLFYEEKSTFSPNPMCIPGVGAVGGPAVAIFRRGSEAAKYSGLPRGCGSVTGASTGRVENPR